MIRTIRTASPIAVACYKETGGVAPGFGQNSSWQYRGRLACLSSTIPNLENIWLWPAAPFDVIGVTPKRDSAEKLETRGQSAFQADIAAPNFFLTSKMPNQRLRPC